MIHTAWRRTVKFLGSAGFATWLLVVLGAWAMLATLVPQGAPSSAVVVSWTSSHRLIAPAVGVLGLHQAFTSPLFIVCVLALALSTSLCAWKRTKVALHKARMIQRASVADAGSLAQSHDLEIACDPALNGVDVLSITGDTLGVLGLKAKRRGDVLAVVSSRWTVWGSPVFHWALLALILAFAFSGLLRSEGLMGVAVGQTKADAPESYGLFKAGPLHGLLPVQRRIRVDAFERAFVTGGIDRGPTPTVSVLDGTGKVIKTQRVYPNMTLKTGSLTIYPSAYGLAAAVTLLDPSGTETGRSYQLVDFMAQTTKEATGGTTPLDSVSVSDSAGKALLRISVTIPLDREGDLLLKKVPEKPSARVVVTSGNGETVVDRVVVPGEQITLPSGDALRLDGVGYYARLQLVDDWTIPALYAGLIAAMLGLAVAVLARQQIILATVIEGPEGMKLAATVRLWRNASSSRNEIESELTKALGGTEQGSMT